MYLYVCRNPCTMAFMQETEGGFQELLLFCHYVGGRDWAHAFGHRCLYPFYHFRAFLKSYECWRDSAVVKVPAALYYNHY